MILTNSFMNGKLVMSTVKDSMLNEEIKRKEHGMLVTPNQFRALVTESRGRSKTKLFYKCDKSKKCEKSRSKSRTRE